MTHFISFHLTSAWAADNLKKKKKTTHYVISSDFIDCLLMCVTNTKFDKASAGKTAIIVQEI